MAVFQRERIRTKVNTDAKAGTSAITDDITGSAPDAWKGTNVQLEIGLFFAGELIDVSNIDILTVAAKDIANKTGDYVINPKSISAAELNATLSQEQWDAGTAQHATVEFSSEEMSIALNGSDFRELWLQIYGQSTDGEPLFFGAARLRVYETGVGSGAAVPAAGSNLIPGGSVYNGSGQYTIAVVSGRTYDWSKGTNDATLVNGTETLSASGRFTAQGSSVTLTGTIGLSVTAALRGSVYYTADEVRALNAGNIKVIMAPGAILWFQTNSGIKRGITLTEDGDIVYTDKIVPADA